MPMYDRKKKMINRYTYDTKKGKKVVVNPHLRTYNYKINTPMSQESAKQLFSQKGKIGDLSKTSSTVYYNPNKDWADDIDKKDVRKIDTYEPKKFKGYTEKETTVIKNIFFNYIIDDNIDVRTLNSLRSKGLIDKDNHATKKLQKIMEDKISKIVTEMILNEPPNMIFNYSNSYPIFCKNELNSDDYEKVMNYLKLLYHFGEVDTEKYKIYELEDEKITGKNYHLDYNNSILLESFFSNIDPKLLAKYYQYQTDNKDKTTKQELVNYYSQNVRYNPIQRFLDFKNDILFFNTLSNAEKILLYDISRRISLDVRTAEKIHDKEIVDKLIDKSLIVKKHDKDTNSDYLKVIIEDNGFSNMILTDYDLTKFMNMFKFEEPILSTEDVTLDSKHLNTIPSRLSYDREYSIGINFDKKEQDKSIVSIEGAPNFTFRLEGYDLFGHTHPDRARALPSPADLKTMVYGQPEFITSTKSNALNRDLIIDDTIILYIEDYNKYVNFCKNVDSDKYYESLDKFGLRYDTPEKVFNDKEKQKFFFDLTGVRILPFKDGMKIKIPANKIDYPKDAEFSNQKRQIIKQALKEAEKDKKYSK